MKETELRTTKEESDFWGFFLVVTYSKLVFRVNIAGSIEQATALLLGKFLIQISFSKTTN